MNRKLKSIHTEEISQKSDLENFFFQCVEEVKKDVTKRRTYQHQSSTQRRSGKLTRAQLLSPEENNFLKPNQ